MAAASSALPLFNTIAEDGPLSDLAAATVLQQLLDYAERREAYTVLLPEHVLLGESGAVQVVEPGVRACGPRRAAGLRADCERALTACLCGVAAADAPQSSREGSVFAAPESAQGAQCAAAAAYSWNLGIFLYVLLGGYQPFASSTPECPFYSEFVTSKQLTCPPHFSTQVITLLCGMIVVLPEHRMSIPVRAASTRARGSPLAVWLAARPTRTELPRARQDGRSG